MTKKAWGRRRKSGKEAPVKPTPQAGTWVMSKDVIGLEVIHVDKPWCGWVYGSDRNPLT